MDTTARVLLAFLAVTFTSNCLCWSDWEDWKAKYGKSYRSEDEEIEHRLVWEKNKLLVEEHNKRSDVSFKLELNSLADKELDKRQAIMTKPKPRFQTLRYRPATDAPDSWDWRKEGVVTPVKSQGQFGDALSFAATDSINSFHAIKTGQLIELSVSEMHDCCVKQPLASPNIFDCVHKIGGLCTQGDYPKPQGKCMNNSCTASADINGGKVVPSGDEEALKEVVSREPVMALIDAGHPSFQLYKDGVYSDPSCSSIRLDHSILIIGYGTMKGEDYWICKNSWGAEWGMEGYVLIARNKNNMCGIATEAIYPD